MIGAILGAIGNLAGAFGAWLKRSERKDHIQAGRNEAILKQREDVEDAEKRMDDVVRGDKRSLLDRLRGSGEL